MRNSKWEARNPKLCFHFPVAAAAVDHSSLFPLQLDGHQLIVSQLTIRLFIAAFPFSNWARPNKSKGNDP
jgi:hypothetical protein